MKDLANKDIELVKVEIEKANFHIALFEWMANKQEDKKTKAEILLKAETLKDTIKKNAVYIQMVEGFIKDLDAVPSPFQAK
jgi:uncharacterized protein YcgL (UPF0745 family)